MLLKKHSYFEQITHKRMQSLAWWRAISWRVYETDSTIAPLLRDPTSFLYSPKSHIKYIHSKQKCWSSKIIEEKLYNTQSRYVLNSQGSSWNTGFFLQKNMIQTHVILHQAGALGMHIIMLYSSTGCWGHAHSKMKTSFSMHTCIIVCLHELWFVCNGVSSTNRNTHAVIELGRTFCISMPEYTTWQFESSRIFSSIACRTLLPSKCNHAPLH